MFAIHSSFFSNKKVMRALETCSSSVAEESFSVLLVNSNLFSEHENQSLVE